MGGGGGGRGVEEGAGGGGGGGSGRVGVEEGAGGGWERERNEELDEEFQGFFHACNIVCFCAAGLLP